MNTLYLSLLIMFFFLKKYLLFFELIGIAENTYKICYNEKMNFSLQEVVQGKLLSFSYIHTYNA